MSSTVDPTRDLIADLFLLMKTAGTHGGDHPATRRSAETTMASLSKANPPFALQFVRKATFRDEELVALDAETFPKSLVVAKGLMGFGAQELAFDQSPGVDGMVKLGELLFNGTKASFDAAGTQIPGVRWRDLPGGGMGHAAEDVDPDVFCATFLALSVARAEELVGARDQPWNWSRGMSVIRRLEAAVESSGDAMSRAFEIAPGTWSPARRAASAAFRYLLVGSKLELNTGTLRAGAHAALAVACHGLGAAGGATTAEAGKVAFERLMADKGMKRSNLPPHRIRVCSLLYELGHIQRAPSEWPGALGLLHLVYELERRRVEPGMDFALTYADLVAQAASQMGTTFEERTVRALVHAAGEIPPGANVRLADGSRGIVLEASDSGDPLRPRVMVGSRILVPDAPVHLLSAREVHGGAGLGA